MLTDCNIALVYDHFLWQLHIGMCACSSVVNRPELKEVNSNTIQVSSWHSGTASLFICTLDHTCFTEIFENSIDPAEWNLTRHYHYTSPTKWYALFGTCQPWPCLRVAWTLKQPTLLGKFSQENFLFRWHRGRSHCSIMEWLLECSLRCIWIGKKLSLKQNK